MSGRLSRAQYPWWVRVSLWGLPRRSAVLGFAWLSVAAAVGVSGYAAWVGNPRWYGGMVFLLAAFLYWRAVRWVDRNGSWERDAAAPGSAAGQTRE